MVRAIGLKLAQLVPVLFIVSLATFLLLELIPGDAASFVAGPEASQEQYQEIREELGLDQPVVQRYFEWLGNTLTGDFGDQLLQPQLPVATQLRSVLPVTLEIAAIALVLALVVAIPAALIAASRPNAAPDRMMSGGAFAAISLPSFLAALLLIFFFVFHKDLVRWAILLVGGVALAYFLFRRLAASQRYPAGEHRRKHQLVTLGILFFGTLIVLWLFFALPDFPRQGFDRWTSDAGIGANLRSAFLPALTLALIEAAVWMRLLRGDLISTLQEDYILAARAKGMPRRRILWRDAIRPSSFSLITVVGVSLGRLVGGTIIVEQIFNLPGMGTLMVTSINGKDIPVVQTGVLLIAVVYVVASAAVDISYAYLDPRIRRGRV